MTTPTINAEKQLPANAVVQDGPEQVSARNLTVLDATASNSTDVRLRASTPTSTTQPTIDPRDIAIADLIARVTYLETAVVDLRNRSVCYS